MISEKPQTQHPLKIISNGVNFTNANASKTHKKDDIENDFIKENITK